MLLIGFAAGFAHVVTGPDHLAALAPFASRNGSAATWRLGLRWGLGHAAGVAVIGLLLWLLRDTAMVEGFSAWSERLEGMQASVKHIPVGRVLDIGCYKGEFLQCMRSKGWDVHGLEFHTRPPNLFDLPIHYGPLETAPFEAASFDLVTIWAVLEHVYDPRRTLEAVRGILRPGGRVVILVPNFNSIPARVMRHDDVPVRVTQVVVTWSSTVSRPRLTSRRRHSSSWGGEVAT